MKKIVMCISLMCAVVMMNGSEKKGAKVTVNSFDELHEQVRRKRVEFNQNKGESYLQHLETKSAKINTERSRLGDTHTSEHQK